MIFLYCSLVPILTIFIFGTNANNHVFLMYTVLSQMLYSRKLWRGLNLTNLGQNTDNKIAKLTFQFMSSTSNSINAKLKNRQLFFFLTDSPNKNLPDIW